LTAQPGAPRNCFVFVSSFGDTKDPAAKAFEPSMIEASVCVASDDPRLQK
jgi:hypothetical protein